MRKLQRSIVELTNQAKVASSELRNERRKLQQQLETWHARQGFLALQRAQLAEGTAELKSINQQIAAAKNRLKREE
jgi:vacuolar-type H+-ATPase subunit D/Vma8